MIVRSGSITGSPKASPGCKGDGVAGPIIGGAIGGIRSTGFGSAGWFALCATIVAKVAALAWPATKASTTSIRAARRMHDIAILRLLRRSGDSPALAFYHGLWPIRVYSPYKPGPN